MPNTKHRLPISYYLPRLSDAGLVELVHTAEEKLKDKSRAFYDWIAPILVAEYSRRGDDSEIPADVDLADSFPFMEWTGAELASALRWITLMSYIVRDKTAGDFIDTVVQHITATVELRLLELDALKVENNE